MSGYDGWKLRAPEDDVQFGDVRDTPLDVSPCSDADRLLEDLTDAIRFVLPSVAWEGAARAAAFLMSIYNIFPKARP